MGAGARGARVRGRGHGQLRRGACSLPRACRRRASSSVSVPRRRSARRGKSDLIDAALAARRLLSGERPEPSSRRWAARGPAPALARAPRRDAGAQRRAQPAERAAGDRSRSDCASVWERSRGSASPSAAARLRPSAEVIERRSAAARPARRATLDARWQRPSAPSLRSSPRSRPTLLEECGVGAGLRRAAARLKRRPRPDEKRGILRRARRHQPGRRLERQAAAPPAQPRRRPPTQLGAPRHRPPTDPPPRPRPGAYYQRLLATGKTTREARRCIKRALARHFYHRLRETANAPLDNIEASVRGIRSGGGWDSNPRVTLTAIAGFQDQTALAQQSHPGKVSVPSSPSPPE